MCPRQCSYILYISMLVYDHYTPAVFSELLLFGLMLYCPSPPTHIFLGEWEEHAILLRNYIAWILLHGTPEVRGERENSVASEVFIVLGRCIPDGDVVYVMLQVCVCVM